MGAALVGGVAGGFLWRHLIDGRPDMEVLPRGERLVILSGLDVSFGAQRASLVRQWNQLHPDQPATVLELPPNADVEYNAMHARLQAKDEGIDLVNLDIPWIAGFAEQGHLRKLSELADDDFLPAPYAAGRFDGDVYALPFNTDVGLLYYRKDVVRGDPPTDSWEQYVQTAESLLRDEAVRERAPELRAGIAMQLGPYEGFTVNVWEVLLSNGAEPVREDLIQVADDHATIAALSRLNGLIEGGTILPDSLEHDEEGSLEAFKEGRTIFLRHWPNAYFQLLTCEAIDFEVGVAPLPGSGLLGGQSLAVTAYSRYPVAAQRLAEFLTNGRSQQLLFERGGFGATREEPYEDAYIRGATPGASADQAAVEVPCVEPGAARGFPVAGVRALEHGLEQAGQRPGVDRYNRFSEVFRDHVHTAFSSGEDVDPDRLQQELEAAVEGR
ncbi:extracellular solute-binding protein [Glycomyces tarimensis]